MTDFYVVGVTVISEWVLQAFVACLMAAAGTGSFGQHFRLPEVLIDSPKSTGLCAAGMLASIWVSPQGTLFAKWADGQRQGTALAGVTLAVFAVLLVVVALREGSLQHYKRPGQPLDPSRIAIGWALAIALVWAMIFLVHRTG